MNKFYDFQLKDTFSWKEVTLQGRGVHGASCDNLVSGTATGVQLWVELADESVPYL